MYFVLLYEGLLSDGTSDFSLSPCGGTSGERAGERGNLRKKPPLNGVRPHACRRLGAGRSPGRSNVG